MIILASFLRTEPSVLTCLLHVKPTDFQESIRYEREGVLETFSMGVTPVPKPGISPLINVPEGMKLTQQRPSCQEAFPACMCLPDRKS